MLPLSGDWIKDDVADDTSTEGRDDKDDAVRDDKDDAVRDDKGDAVRDDIPLSLLLPQ